MKKKYISFLMIIIGICSASSIEQEQELIISPKNKKKYVSKEQCVDGKVDSAVLINECNRSINMLRQTVDTIQKEDFDMLSDYADGEKNCFFKQADKVVLTKYHEKEMQLNHELEHSSKEIQKMQQRLESLRSERLKIQSELSSAIS